MNDSSDVVSQLFHDLRYHYEAIVRCPVSF